MLCMLVPFLIQLCGDTRTSDIENCVQGGPIFAAESHQGQFFCCGGKANDRKEKGADTHRGPTWGDKIIILMCKGFFWCERKEALNLVVPLIYFWCGAIHIDVPLSGSVCGWQAIPVLHFLSSQKENAQWCMSHYLASRWDRAALGTKDFYIDQDNCQGQASSSAQSVIFLTSELRHTAIWGGRGLIVVVMVASLCFTSP